MLPRLSNFELDEIIQQAGISKDFMGCFPKNLLAKQKAQAKFAIVNNHNANQSGSHWTAIYACSNQPAIICFDSMGAPPAEEILKFARKCAKKFNKPITYQSIQVQQLASDSCGWFCVYVLAHLKAGYDYSTIMTEFSQNPILNETLLARFFKVTLQNFHTIQAKAMQIAKASSIE
jgi:hypothetical protein